MMRTAVRRIASVTLLAALVSMPLVARAATPAGPVVDVIEIAGIIDRPIANYAMEQIRSAEQHHDALVVFEVDSLGGLKISDSQAVPPLVRRIREARVPIAVHVGPRGARAEGLILYMAAAANVASIGPSGHIGPPHPIDFGRTNVPASQELDALRALAESRKRSITTDAFRVLGANEAKQAGYFDLVTPSVATFLEGLDGQTVTTVAGTVTLRLPSNETIVRFSQPGPIRRLLHAFANPTLVYLLLIAGALLVVFELFQPGFGVAHLHVLQRLPHCLGRHQLWLQALPEPGLLQRLPGRQAVGRNLRSRIEPRQLTAQLDRRDLMIKLRWRRNVGIKIAVTADKDGIALNSFDPKQRLQQCVLVFAVAEAVLQDFRRGMGL